MLSKNVIVHGFYKIIGKTLCRLHLFWCSVRDCVSNPKTEAILIVAHPDDDTLFFHTFIKKYNPYVCLMTTGWSLRRSPCFVKTMREYRVRFRMYDLESRDTRCNLLAKNVASCLNMGRFKICATHGPTGEYGHEMHRRVHEAVVSQAHCTVLVPVTENEIEAYPISNELIQEKKHIFNNNYTTELFVLDQYKKWVEHEHLVEFKRSH